MIILLVNLKTDNNEEGNIQMDIICRIYRKIVNVNYIIYLKIKYGKRISIGKGFSFRKGLIINISKDGFLNIGNNCFFNNYCSINVHKKVIIGNNNIFGENVKIYDHDHAFHKKNFKKEFYENEIIIGDNNWICSNVTILRKSKLGNENVIGAGVIFNEKIKDSMIIKNENNVSIKKIKRI